MKSSEKLFDKIEAYLAGELSGQALQDFERELGSNSQLAAEVKLHREMGLLLEEDLAENEFRDSLKQIDKETKITKPFWKNLVWLMLPVLAIAFWWMTRTETEIPTPQENPVEEIIQEQNGEAEETESIPTKTPSSKTPPQQKKTPKKPIAQTKPLPKKEVSKPSKNLMAANFEVNPLLEPLVNNNRRSGDIHFILDKHQENTILKNADQSTQFHIAGTALTEESIETDQFNLYIFTNKRSDYENFSPLYTKNLELSKNEDQYVFELKEQLFLQPGLYYYLIEDIETEEQFLVGKFSCKE